MVRSAGQTAAPRRRPMTASRSRWTVATLGLAGVIAYCVGMAWPYFEALIVRDAAVTSWISVTSSLVAGYTTNPLYPGQRVGADGRIATVVDPRTSTTELVRARAELARTKAR